MNNKINKPGWQLVRLGDVVHQVKDKLENPSAFGITDYVPGGGISDHSFKITEWLPVNDGLMGPAFHMRFLPGHVLYKSRVPHGVAVANREGICANTTYVLEAIPNKLLQELLPFILTTEQFRQFEYENNRGSTNLFLNYNQIANYEFALPPLDEQRKIIIILNAIEKLIHNLSTLKAENSRLQVAIVEDFIGQVSNNVAMKELLQEVNYGSSTRANDDMSGIPILRIPNVLRNEINLSDLKWVKLSKYEVERYSVREGDILIVRTNGNPDYVGRCVVAHNPPTPLVFASYLIRIRIKQELVDPDYVATVLNSPTLRQYLRGSVRSSAGNYNLNTQGISRQQIPLTTLQEQRALIGVLRTLQNANEKVSKRIRATQLVKNRTLNELRGYSCLTN